MLTSTQARVDTELTADATAFCPYNGRRHLLACACYQLVKDSEPPQRVGRLQLYDTRGRELKEVGRVDGRGHLDCQWMPGAVGPQLLATASSDGVAHLFRLDESGTSLAGVAEAACPGAGDACITVDWCPAQPRLALSSTEGRLFVLDAAPDCARCLHAWTAHDDNGWSVAFDRAEPHTLYSGGDDCVLKRWDLRAASGPDEDTGVATATNRRSHGAGICCISPHPSRTHMLATGSYDEKVRLWDCRNMRQPTVELSCGGGVWRIKWHPSVASLALAACMHGGFKVLELESTLDETPSIREVAAYGEHGVGQALAYGADWAHPSQEGDAHLASTCSFYDHALHLWTYGTAAA